MRQNAPCEGPRGRDYVRLLASQGRRGDTLVAHISPLEAAILHLLGGAGTINPKTGLPEFWGLGGGGSSGGHGDAGDGTGGAASGGNRGSNRSGRGNENSATGGRSASQRDSSYGGGYSDRATSNGGGNENSAAGLTRGTTEDRNASYGGSYGGQAAGSTGLGGYYAAFGNAYTNLAPTVGPTMGDIADILKMSPSTPASLLGRALGFGVTKEQETRETAAAIRAGIEQGKSVDIDGAGPANVQNGNLSGGVTGADTDTGRLTHDIASGAFAGGDISGYDRDHNNGGKLSDHSSVARNAQQANAGGGLLAVPTSQAAPTPMPVNLQLPVGLLQYLAQNPGLLQGLVANTRFGPGTVAPIQYGQPFA